MARDPLVFHGSLAQRVVDEAEPIRTGGAGGQFLAVTGTGQSGRSTLLRSLANGFEEAGWRVVFREVRDGVLVAPRGDGLRRAAWAIQAAKVAGAGLQVAGGPVGSLVALVAELATAGHMAAEEQPAETGDEYVQLNRLVVALERAAAAAPIAVLIDDADELDRPDVWWDVLLGTQIPDLVADLPLVCVVGAERSSVARGSPAWDVLDALLADGVAEEVRLGPLDRAAVTEALGAVEPNLADQLLALAQRRPGWVAGLWELWRDEELVVRRDGRWEFGTDGYARARATAVHRWVETSLRASLPDRCRYDQALGILELGALEGPHFTAEVVAAMLSTDVEDLIDWLDEHLAAPDDDEGTSVLVEDGFVARSGGEPLCRYRFRSLLAAGALRDKVLRSTEGTTLAGRYAKTLAAVYRWSAPGEAATAIVRLATHAGDTALVEETWARANRLAGVAEAARLGTFLAERLERKGLSTDELAVRVRRLNEVNHLIRGRWDTEGGSLLCDVALRAARKAVAAEEASLPDGRSKHVRLLVDALQYAGHAAADDGNVERAAELFRAAAERSATTPDRLNTADLWGLAGQAQVHLATDGRGVADAVTTLQTALDYIGDDATLRVLQTKSRIHTCLTTALSRTPWNHRKAAWSLARSVDALVGVLGAAPVDGLAPAPSSPSLTIVAILDAANNLASTRRDASHAERFLAAILDYRLATVHQLVVLVNLSTVRERQDKARDAAWAACQALRLAHERGSAGEARPLERLARAAALLESPAAAAFALLSRNRLSQTESDQQFPAGLGGELARLDDGARRRIEKSYSHDRGASLVRETFGIDMAEIDRTNARLGRATAADLRRHLAMVADYAAQVIAAEGSEES